MAGEAGAPRRIVPKAGFEIEIDQCGNLRAMTCGELAGEMSNIKITEGGAIQVVVQQSTNKVKYPAVEITRPLDLSDRTVAEWWAKTESGEQDHRNGTFFYVVGGVRVAKKSIEDICITKFSDGEGDAKSEDDPQMEKFTIEFTKLGALEVL